MPMLFQSQHHFTADHSNFNSTYEIRYALFKTIFNLFKHAGSISVSPRKDDKGPVLQRSQNTFGSSLQKPAAAAPTSQQTNLENGRVIVLFFIHILYNI